MPSEVWGVLLGEKDQHSVIALQPKSVLIDVKLLPTGEWVHTFTNKGNNPAVITITRTTSL